MAREVHSQTIVKDLQVESSVSIAIGSHFSVAFSLPLPLSQEEERLVVEESALKGRGGPLEGREREHQFLTSWPCILTPGGLC